MPKYLVQKFTHESGGDATMYGDQGAHDHDKYQQFTPDSKDWLLTNFHWEKKATIPGPFLSSQAKPTFGHELRWDGKKWVGV
ncbi:hypothetical protein [uncultured Aquimarina sp.]|uniref:hypothetical protein n=1 Tax=uncultured Aquimarina sp. TaxID=575652 RepID=UPI002603253D|nr:hypothetical protein [uncultured Aquimarina sp.]